MEQMKLLLLFAAASCAFAFQATGTPEAARWQQEARNVTIVRDDWGIAHVYGKSDADAVFGMIYAQAEDDFNRAQRVEVGSGNQFRADFFQV
jgi:acyl-homoserine-lactone acylase